MVALTAILMARDRTWPRPWPRSAVVVIAVLMFGTLVALFRGTSVRDIGSDLFPIVELFAFGYLIFWLIKDAATARRTIWMLLLWGGIVAGLELVLYLKVGYLFATRVLVGGCIFPRLDDFVPILLMPGALMLLAVSRTPARGVLAAAAAVSIAMAITMSFFRTTWLASGIGVASLLAASATQPRLIIRVVVAGAGLAVAVAILLFFAPLAFAYAPKCEPANQPAAASSPSATPRAAAVPTTGVAETSAGASPSSVPTALIPTATGTAGATTFAPEPASPLPSPPTPAPLVMLITSRVDSETVTTEPNSFQGRIEANLDLLRAVRENVLLGTGFGGKFQNTRSTTLLPLSSAPNWFLAMVVELGLPAAGLLLAVVTAQAWRAVRSAAAAAPSMDRALVLGGLAGIVGVLVSLAIFPAPLHFALGPLSVVYIRAARLLPQPTV
jgi:hypothetical protein